MKRYFTVFLFASLSLFSCTDENNDLSEEAPAGFQFFRDTISRQVGDCAEENASCYRIKWIFPQMKGNDNFSAIVNEEVLKVVTGNLDPEGRNAEDLEKLIAGMQDDFREFVNDFPESGVNAWFDDTEGEVLINNEKVISIGLTNSSFYGGAHPNSYRTYLNFSPEKKKKLKTDDLFSDTTAVARIVEKHFREERELGDDADLNDEGFFLLDDGFFLPASIGIKENVFIFYYNPYEIGPYSLGATEVIVKREELENYTKI